MTATLHASMKPVEPRVTADTITDAQIKRVRTAMLGIPRKTSYHRAVLQDCDGALHGSRACRESVADSFNRMSGWADGHTITDEQIRTLLDDRSLSLADRVACNVALRIPVGRKASGERNEARDRVAALINARLAK